METQIERPAIEAVVQGLERAWNAASGEDFAAYCEADADFVNIYGMHARGRQAIAAGHDHIFRTVYEGSRLKIEVKQLRWLSDSIALVHVESKLQVPKGPLAGELASVPSMVLRRSEAGWFIVAFQNTLVANPPGEKPGVSPSKN